MADDSASRKEETEKVTEGRVFRSYPGSVPVNAAEPATDGNGMSYQRTRVTYRNIGTTRGEITLFGDVPAELQDFMPGKRFMLKELYQDGGGEIPAVQHFRAADENGNAMQYQFRRK